MDKIIRIFIGAPSDVDAEREIINKVIKDMNKFYRGTGFPQFDIIELKKDVRSNIGSGLEAQEVIDSTISEKYDLFIGILWKKFGSPTKKYESGTQQEFENALDSDADVMFYFSNQPVTPDEIIPEQLEKIKKFKNEIKDEGLYFDYSSLDDFEELITNNLRIIAIEKNKKSDSSPKTEIGEDNGIEEKSMFDLFESTLNNFKNVENDIKELSNLFEDSNIKFNMISPPDENIHSYKIYCNSVADLLNELSVDFKDKKTNLINNYSNGINDLIESLELFGSYMDDNTRNNIKKGIDSNIDVLTDFNKQMNDVIDTYNKIPPLTNKLIRSRKKLIEGIKELLKDLKNIRSLLYRALIELEDS